jgi:hypothetical protein
MAKKQLPVWVKTAWEFVKPLIPVIKEKIQSGEWSGRFRKETKEEIEKLWDALRVQTEINEKQQVIIDELVKEIYETEEQPEIDAD